MKPHEDFKEVEIKGRKFVVKKFDARTGSYMLLKVTGLIAPLFKGLDLKKIKVKQSEEDEEGAFNLSDIDISGIASGLTSLSEQDFNYVQEKCLQVCYENLQAGPTKILNTDGTFGVIGLENDTMTVMALTAHALMFNVKGFFGGSPLGSILGGFLSMKSFTAKI